MDWNMDFRDARDGYIAALMDFYEGLKFSTEISAIDGRSFSSVLTAKYALVIKTWIIGLENFLFFSSSLLNQKREDICMFEITSLCML